MCDVWHHQLLISAVLFQVLPRLEPCLQRYQGGQAQAVSVFVRNVITWCMSWLWCDLVMVALHSGHLMWRQLLSPCALFAVCAVHYLRRNYPPLLPCTQGTFACALAMLAEKVGHSPCSLRFSTYRAM